LPAEYCFHVRDLGFPYLIYLQGMTAGSGMVQFTCLTDDFLQISHLCSILKRSSLPLSLSLTERSDLQDKLLIRGIR
jgi:hypothetical protein